MWRIFGSYQDANFFYFGGIGLVAVKCSDALRDENDQIAMKINTQTMVPKPRL